ncbi:hypothetical protein ABCS02_23000 [Microbacterium sp. X-17]|uniref:hypothetical protein n=1 Tax=Microbacterium sp. X-17 TaxID=3144404 RepID=UPI0031F53C58
MRFATWCVLGAAVVAGAVAQGLTAEPGITLLPAWLVVLLVVASTAVLAAQLAVGAWATRALSDRAPLGGIPGTLLVWSAGIAVALFTVALLAPLVLPLLLAAALCVLPAAARGRRNALVGFAAFRCAPWGSVAATIVTVVVSILAAVGAVLAGLLLTGVPGGIAMWLGFGILAALLLRWWSRLTRTRPRPEKLPLTGSF